MVGRLLIAFTTLQPKRHFHRPKLGRVVLGAENLRPHVDKISLCARFVCKHRKRKVKSSEYSANGSSSIVCKTSRLLIFRALSLSFSPYPFFLLSSLLSSLPSLLPPLLPASSPPFSLSIYLPFILSPALYLYPNRSVFFLSASFSFSSLLSFSVSPSSTGSHKKSVRHRALEIFAALFPPPKFGRILPCDAQSSVLDYHVYDTSMS